MSILLRSLSSGYTDLVSCRDRRPATGYAPLAAGLLHPDRRDRIMSSERLTQLDKLYQSVVTAIDQLVVAVGLKVAV